jgi:hypothetical protein
MSKAQIKECLKTWKRWVNEGILKPHEFEDMVYKRGWQEIAQEVMK